MRGEKEEDRRGGGTKKEALASTKEGEGRGPLQEESPKEGVLPRSALGYNGYKRGRSS